VPLPRHATQNDVGDDVGVVIGREAEFAGQGSYIELPRQLLPHSRDPSEEMIKITVTTEHENALLFWQGQTATISGRGKDYLAIAVQNGYPVFRYSSSRRCTPFFEVADPPGLCGLMAPPIEHLFNLFSFFRFSTVCVCTHVMYYYICMFML